MMGLIYSRNASGGAAKQLPPPIVPVGAAKVGLSQVIFAPPSCHVLPSLFTNIVFFNCLLMVLKY